MSRSVQYTDKKKAMIHNLLETVFSPEALDEFYAEHFPDLFDPLTADMDDEAKIQLLIEDCAQKKTLGKLIALVKTLKPDDYQAFVDNLNAAPAQAAPPEPAADSSSSEPTRLARATRQASKIISNPQALLNKSIAGRYQIEEILDQSGLGAVFKAYDTKLDLSVAIKVIDLNRVSQPAIRERVRQEVRTAMSLDHPNIVKIYDLGEAGSLLFIVMEFISGRNLEQAREVFQSLGRSTTLPQIVQLFQRICLTVDYLHQQRILHPGTKPVNIMLKAGNSEGALQPVLINLGLLRPSREVLFSDEKISTRRLTYSVSPELLLDHATDIRSDVYALGVILYEMVVGEPPFKPATLEEALRLHIDTPPPPPRSIHEDIPEALEQIILKALAKDPADRFLSAKGMAQALGDYLDSTRLPEPAPSTALPSGLNTNVSMDTQPMVVVPGQSVVRRILLHNQGSQEDRRRIEIEGLPAEWFTVTPASTTLAPDEKQEIEIKFHPPRAPQSTAGRQSLTIRIENQPDTAEFEELKLVLTISTYTELDSNLYPKKIQAGQTTQVTVENLGNMAQTFTVLPKPDRALNIQPDRVQKKLAPGESGTFDFVIKPRRRYLIGNTAQQTFSLQVSTPNLPTVTHSGEVVSHSLVSPKWALGALLGVCLIFCAAVALFYSINLTPATSQAIINAQQATGTALVQAAVSSQNAAGVAATSTAFWLTQDSDGDELLNQQELQLGTDPNNPDSDSDGLYDGLEVNQYGTKPRIPDTDGDGVNDGDEIRAGLNPLSTDSNNDGIPDAYEPSPAERLTPTPNNATSVPPPVGNIIVGFYDPRPWYLQVFPPANNLYRPTYTVREDARTATIWVVLNQAAREPVRVDYQTGNNTAYADEDYVATRGTLEFSPGVTSQTFDIIIFRNGLRTGDRIVNLYLSNPQPGGVQLGLKQAELVIQNVD